MGGVDDDARPPGRRERARAATLRAIGEEARRQLAQVGAAGLSLRAIARELGMVSSGIYRYVESRDELLTRLIVDAYGDLADAVEGAAGGDGDPRRAWAAACRAVRGWALARPHEWALLYGSPVPGYAAPERTTESATRLYVALARAVGGAPAPATRLDPTLAGDAARLAEALALPDPALGIRLLGALGHLVGVVSLEVFGHLTGVVDEAARDAHFDAQVELAAAVLGL